jgi:hypothetical protein
MVSLAFQIRVEGFTAQGGFDDNRGCKRESPAEMGQSAKKAGF